jgi:MFS family permease
VIADIWDAETRGKALALFTLAPFAGPAIGPTVAGFVGENTSWRWVFWILAIFVRSFSGHLNEPLTMPLGIFMLVSYHLCDAGDLRVSSIPLLVFIPLTMARQPCIIG